jgi:hypothetical protein
LACSGGACRGATVAQQQQQQKREKNQRKRQRLKQKRQQQQQQQQQQPQPQPQPQPLPSQQQLQAQPPPPSQEQQQQPQLPAQQQQQQQEVQPVEVQEQTAQPSQQGKQDQQASRSAVSLVPFVHLLCSCIGFVKEQWQQTSQQCGPHVRIVTPCLDIISAVVWGASLTGVAHAAGLEHLGSGQTSPCTPQDSGAVSSQGN